MEVSHSTGPDPTIFKQHPKYPNVQIAQPPQPQSQPMQLNNKTDDSIFTPIIPSPVPNDSGSGHHHINQSSQTANSGGLHRSLGGLGMPRSKVNGFASKPKGLVRKLSRRSPPAPIQTKKSMGPDPFEARPFSPVQSSFDVMEVLGSGEIQSGTESEGMEMGVKKVKACTFPRGPGVRERTSIPDLPILSPVATVSFPVTTQPSPAINTTEIQQSNLASSQIRSASGSIVSHHKNSIKSSPSRRAEREWRAKVAGMAVNNRSPKIGGRGPVPPKRHYPLAVTVPAPGPTYSPLGQSALAQGAQGGMVTTPTTPSPHRSFGSGPVSGEVGDKGTPAKSFVSNRSFETLGHYANLSPTRAGIPAARAGVSLSVASPGTRHCDVPRSVVSSFYFDNTTSRVSTHLSPVVQPSLLLPVTAAPNQVGSSIGSPRITDRPVSQAKAALPPFSSFQLSPASVGPPLSPIPGGDTSRQASHSSLLPAVPGAARRSSDGMRVSDPSNQTRLSNHQVSPTTMLATSQSSSSSGEVPKTPMRSNTEILVDRSVGGPPITPITNKQHPHSAGPGTPYSPTTAYILQAEDIDQVHLFASDIDLGIHVGHRDDEHESESRFAPGQRHPYARTPSMMIDSPPTQKSRHLVPVPSLLQGRLEPVTMSASGSGSGSGFGLRKTMPLCPRHEVISPPCRHTPHLSVHQHQYPSRSTSRQHQHHRQYIDRDESSQRGIKADIIGVGAGGRQRSYGASGSTVLSHRKVDLTPGMESGYRPPKSGLPVAVSSQHLPRPHSRYGLYADPIRTSRGG